MNRKRAKALLPIITAFAEGKEIQYEFPKDVWNDLTGEQGANFGNGGNWRIKPKTKTIGYGVLLWGYDDGPAAHCFYDKESFEKCVKSSHCIRVLKAWEEFEIEVNES